MSNFSQADAEALFSRIRSAAKKLGLAAAVIGHDPEAAPPAGLSYSIMLGPVKPILSSGLDAASGEITLMVHVWSSASKRPLDKVDPDVLWATCALMGALAGSFTLGGTVRDIDIYSITAAPGYVPFEGKEYRVMQITVPIEINDMWVLSA